MKIKKNEITVELLNTFLEYRDGDFYWIKKPAPRSNRIKIGAKAGSMGIVYREIRIFGNLYKIHMLVFFIHNNRFPKLLDHKDRNPLNNRIENLREATYSDNCSNKAVKKNKINNNPYMGVYYHRKKWRAALVRNRISYHGGVFDNKEDAALAYNKLAVKHHGEFANLNIIKI